LVEIIDRAYHTFSKYKLKEELDVCTVCCVTFEEKKQLETNKLNEIPLEAIYSHNTSATTAKPPIEEFKYFLPRYLELIANNQFPSHSIELSLKRFEHYEKTEFSQQEWEIIHEFCRQYFKKTILNYPSPSNEGIDSILIMLFKTKINLHEILTIWKLDNSKSGNQHFKDLINIGLSSRKNKLSNPFSSRVLDKIIEEWLTDKELFEKKYVT